MKTNRIVEVAVKSSRTHGLPDGHHDHELHGIWTDCALERC